jgi:hypothetical protein
VNEVRFQVVRLMRMLVQVCQTLDQVPDEVSCKPEGCGRFIEKLDIACAELLAALCTLSQTLDQVPDEASSIRFAGFKCHDVRFIMLVNLVLLSSAMQIEPGFGPSARRGELQVALRTG